MVYEMLDVLLLLLFVFATERSEVEFSTEELEETGKVRFC